MFNKEKALIEDKVLEVLKKSGINPSPLIWSWIPFSGHWGLATSFFKTASINSHFKPEILVQKRAEEIANLVSNELELPKEFEKKEAVKGYLNIYFDSADYAKSIVQNIISESNSFGK